LNLNRPVLS